MNAVLSVTREITFQYSSLFILLFNYSHVSKYPLNNIACKASQKSGSCLQITLKNLQAVFPPILGATPSRSQIHKPATQHQE